MKGNKEDTGARFWLGGFVDDVKDVGLVLRWERVE